MADPGDWAYLIRDHRLAALLAVKASLTEGDLEFPSGRELNGNLLEGFNDLLFRNAFQQKMDRKALETA